MVVLSSLVIISAIPTTPLINITLIDVGIYIYTTVNIFLIIIIHLLSESTQFMVTLYMLIKSGLLRYNNDNKAVFFCFIYFCIISFVLSGNLIIY